MRFLYIDSQGKEVPIPTVEALALRIELGAITEETRLYDAAADRWAPAGEQEIFRSLARELVDKSGGFVAPPPPAPAAPPLDPPPPPVAETPAVDVPVESAEPPKPRVSNPFEALEGPDGDPGLADEAEPEGSLASEASGGSSPPSEPDGTIEGFDFGLTLEPEPGDHELEALPETPEPAAPGSFDFGGAGGCWSTTTGMTKRRRARPSRPT